MPPLQIGGAPAAMSLQLLRDRVRLLLDSDIERGEPVARQDVRIGAFLEQQRCKFLAVERRRPMKRRALRDLPVIDARVDRLRLFAKRSLDLIAKIERHGVVQIQRAVLTHPLNHCVLLVVVGPAERR